MGFSPRTIAGYFAIALIVGATAWAVSLGTLPPAEFTFVNNTEIKSVDPATATGVPEGRIISGLFEGLVEWHPQTLEPMPGTAEHWDISPDKLQYTFRIRRDARWSDGSPVTARDFHWSMRRMLDPMLASEYSYQLWYVTGARLYNTGKVEPGDAVEVELNERPPGALPFARGKVLKRRLARIENPPSDQVGGAKVYVVKFGSREERFSTASSGDARPCKQVLPDFDGVGIKVLDERTIQFRLDYPTPYFLNLLGFYPLSPVNQRCLETHGYPAWTKPANLVTNGPYVLESRRIRDRMRLARSETYWNRRNVKLATIDALAVESPVTTLNLYLTGKVDWIPYVPPIVVNDLRAQKRNDFYAAPEFTTYFYRLNVTKPPLDNPKVRKALALALDRREVVKVGSRGGEQPSYSLVPPGVPGYEPARCAAKNVQRARELLAEAGYPGGRGLPKFSILYNTMESHQAIAEIIQDQWKRDLGVSVYLQNQEWAAYLASINQLDYQIARAGWVGDYLDPNTFLNLFVTDGANNKTGWGSAEYDRLIVEAGKESDHKKRLELFHRAEEILMDELPVIPIYVRICTHMVRPYVTGFSMNAQDVHPLGALGIDYQKKRLLEQEAAP